VKSGLHDRQCSMLPLQNAEAWLSKLAAVNLAGCLCSVITDPAVPLTCSIAVPVVHILLSPERSTSSRRRFEKFISLYNMIGTSLLCTQRELNVNFQLCRKGSDHCAAHACPPLQAVCGTSEQPPLMLCYASVYLRSLLLVRHHLQNSSGPLTHPQS
jgi:hypothetical protein